MQVSECSKIEGCNFETLPTASGHNKSFRISTLQHWSLSLCVNFKSRNLFSLILICNFYGVLNVAGDGAFRPRGSRKSRERVLGCLVPWIWIVTTPNMEYNPILRGLQWDPATSSSCCMGIPSRDSEAHMPQDMDNPAKQQVPDPSKSRVNEHRFECTWAEFWEWASKTAARFDYEVQFVGVGGDKEYEDIISDDTTGPGFAIQVAISAHNSVLFPIVRKEGELPSFICLWFEPGHIWVHLLQWSLHSFWPTKYELWNKSKGDSRSVHF